MPECKTPICSDRAWEGSDGAQAIELYHAHHPDIVIMDIEMEPVDGITATRAIHDEDDSATIVVMSKHEGSGIEQAVARAGGSRFLPKIDLNSLPALLEQLLRVSR